LPDIPESPHDIPDTEVPSRPLFYHAEKTAPGEFGDFFPVDVPAPVTVDCRIVIQTQVPTTLSPSMYTNSYRIFLT
jgi:hypothetical protein